MNYNNRPQSLKCWCRLKESNLRLRLGMDNHFQAVHFHEQIQKTMFIAVLPLN